MSALYEAFSRVPTSCANVAKIQVIGTPRWFGAVWAGFDVSAALGKVLVFGHLASIMARHGIAVTGRSTPAMMTFLREWWLGKRNGSTVQGYLIEAHLDLRIARELTRFGIEPGMFFETSFRRAVGQFAAGFHPGATPGWLAASQTDNGIRALFYPETADGPFLALCRRQTDAPIDDPRAAFSRILNAILRASFIRMTSRDSISDSDRMYGANQWSLMCYHVLSGSNIEDPSRLAKAVESLQVALGAHFEEQLKQAHSDAGNHCYLLRPDVPAPRGIFARWTGIGEHWENTCDEHHRIVRNTINEFLESRSTHGSYRPVCGLHAIPTAPTESEYFEIAKVSPGDGRKGLRNALKARLMASAELRANRAASLSVCQSAMDRMQKEADELVVQVGYALAIVELSCTCVLVGPHLSFLDYGWRPGHPTPRMIRSREWTTMMACRELTAIAAVNSILHAPTAASDRCSLLAKAYIFNPDTFGRMLLVATDQTKDGNAQPNSV